MTLTEHMKTMLTAIYGQVRRLESVPKRRPTWMKPFEWSALVRAKSEYRHYGIRHDLADWLGGEPSAARSAVYSRTLRRMAEMGLLVRVSRWSSTRTTHVRLTRAGRKQARRIAQEAAQLDWPTIDLTSIDDQATLATEQANHTQSGDQD